LKNFSVVSDVDEDNVIDRIEEAAAQTPFVVVDLEGTAAKIVLLAVSQADFVVIPHTRLPTGCGAGESVTAPRWNIPFFRSRRSPT
jgi:hypothetical protein